MQEDEFEAYGEGDEGLYFLALGGIGFFGMNMYLYGYKGKWLIVDCGIGFPDDSMPGIDTLYADPSFIEERKDDIIGLVITHAHEDHIGAVPLMWERFQCPIYASEFTLEILRRKIRETKLLEKDMGFNLVNQGGHFQAGPFTCNFIRVDHSIPEASALSIKTDDGIILHTGDWKIDHKPLWGEGTDEEALRKLGEEGVLAVVGDSTNANVEGCSGSETDVAIALRELFSRYKDGQRILVSCFSSNLMRVSSIAKAAKANGRKVVLVGRSLWNMVGAAKATGYLKDIDDFIRPEEAKTIPSGEMVVLCTGSQGEKRAALWRIAMNGHPGIDVSEGDVVVFSSRTIPGNEKGILEIQNKLLGKGMEVVTVDDAPIHVSGHGSSEDITRMYQWLKPEILIPMHGEKTQLVAHMELAKACQIKKVIMPHNGDIIQLNGQNPRIVDDAPHDILALEGNRLISLSDAGAMKKRRRMMFDGVVIAHIVLDAAGLPAANPKITALGLMEEDEKEAFLPDMAIAIAKSLDNMPKKDRFDDAAVDLAARRVLRRNFKKIFRRKPPIEVEVTRLDW